MRTAKFSDSVILLFLIFPVFDVLPFGCICALLNNINFVAMTIMRTSAQKDVSALRRSAEYGRAQFTLKRRLLAIKCL